MTHGKKMSLVMSCFVLSAFLFAGISAYAAVADKVIVVVNDEVITQGEFDRAFASIKAAFVSKFSGSELTTRLDTAKKTLMEQLVNSKLAVSLAKKANLTINEAELDERVNKIKTYYDSEDAFLQNLDAKGTNLTELKKDMRDQMLAQKLIEREISSKIVVPPAEIKDLYENNKEQFISPVKVKVRGIMVRKGLGADPRIKTANAKSGVAEGMDEDYVAGVLNRSVMKKSIEELHNEVKGGKDFSEVASLYSEGPYAKTGGDMGYISPGQTMGEIDEVIFSLTKGEVSDIVETSIGYHVFKVEDIQKEKQLSYDEVSEYLKEQLYMKRFEGDLARWLEKKKKNA
ncbi:MAG: peptidylprolyl isomerase, partial [Candidatus Omnitrophica bacterium]|nr:peptidylprolyl isomerase [Candidatus Omnitrophota bacterium]